jgi:catechol 2,3-dioxygenase-like lactoylglutathione lyase family enzyme
MGIVFGHTNIVTRDWKRLAGFYETVFECKRLRPRRRLGGRRIATGTGLKGAKLEGVHLVLPGHGGRGPTLEIFQYHDLVNEEMTMPNTCGFRHIAFEVANVSRVHDLAIQCGGAPLGTIVSTRVRGVGNVTFVYIRDPDGNIIELQSWGQQVRGHGKVHKE